MLLLTLVAGRARRRRSRVGLVVTGPVARGGRQRDRARRRPPSRSGTSPSGRCCWSSWSSSSRSSTTPPPTSSSRSSAGSASAPLVAIVVWVVASAAFGFYVANFSNYDKTYGSLAGVIVFLLWLWITNLALLFGAELDAELERGRELQAGIPAEETIQLPPRDTRKIDKAEAKEAEDVARGRECG